MSDIIADILPECSNCKHEFNEGDHLPRRMPCCVQSICHHCLQNLIRDQTLLCPLCRHEHTLPDGVASLPREPLMLKILDHLKIQKGLRLPCTDCPDGNVAIARCDDCCVFLCEECHRAHARFKNTRRHKTVTFDEMKGRPVESLRKLHECKEHQQTQQFYCRTCKQVICVSCTVVQHDKSKNHDVVSVKEAHTETSAYSMDIQSKLHQKSKMLDQTVKDLQRKRNNIQTSRKRATEDVNATFDTLIELLENRRHDLLFDIENKSDIDLKRTDQALNCTSSLLNKVKSSTEFIRHMRKKADRIEDLQLMTSSTDALRNMLDETPQNVQFDRTGVTFVPVQVTQIKALIDVLGTVRTVTFEPLPKPSYVTPDKVYNSVTMTPDEVPSGPRFDLELHEEKHITCPHLEFDYNTANCNVRVSSDELSNDKSDLAAQETGCRLLSIGRALTTRPLLLRRGQVVVFSIRVEVAQIKSVEESQLLWEAALTPYPVDTGWIQRKGLSLAILASITHKQLLSFQVWYDGKLITELPLFKNGIGESFNLQPYVMIDRNKNTIHIVRADTEKLITSVRDVALDKPQWILTHVGEHVYADIKSQVISGNKVALSQNLKLLLFSLQRKDGDSS